MFRRRRGGDDAGEPEVFQIRERLVDIGDDYWIETTAGRRAYKVNGKVLRVRGTILVEDPDGRELIKMKHRPVRMRETWTISRAGAPDATVHKALVTPLRNRWTVEADDIGEWKVKGNILDHAYTIEADGGGRVAEVSKKWVRVRDTYGIKVEPDFDTALALAVTVAIDQTAHD